MKKMKISGVSLALALCSVLGLNSNALFAAPGEQGGVLDMRSGQENNRLAITKDGGAVIISKSSTGEEFPAFGGESRPGIEAGSTFEFIRSGHQGGINFHGNNNTGDPVDAVLPSNGNLGHQGADAINIE